MQKDVLDFIDDLGVLPVISPANQACAVPLATALCKGGLPAIEITLRTAWALDSIAQIRQAVPDMAIGAGTVLTPEQAVQAKNAGANFIVAPGFDPALVRKCQELSLPVVPGCSNPSEITAALNMGLKVVKFFPAESLGGIKMLSDFKGPFADCRFMATGGLNLDNIGSYLDKPFVSACGGSFVAKNNDMLDGNWDKIVDNCRKCVDISLGFQLAHVGVNNANETEALATAQAFAKVLRMPLQKDSASGVFNGTAIENRKQMYYGTHGHIGFTTRSLKRALAWYRRNNIPVNEATISRDAKGNLTCFYLQDEIAGFAIHFMAK